MKMKPKKKQQEDARPVLDGDSRPDQNPGSENSAATEKGNKTKNKVTTNRDGDINSLEDFKDSK
jgi:hypothetical protein